MDLQAAKKLLSDAGLFFYPIGQCDDPEDEQTLNMNDTWGWALAWGVRVEDEEILEVSRLFLAYGFCGVLYWVSEKYDKMQSEFSHVNRMVQFVRNEEALRLSTKPLTKYAYTKVSYTINS